MKKESSENLVRINGIPKLSEKQREKLNKLAVAPDNEIDTTDIPEVTDFSGFETGKFYRPLKETVTIRIDSDVLHWLKQGGRGYQSRLNAILRKEMTSSARATKRKVA